MSNYQKSWELLERIRCGKDPSEPCPVHPSENLRPCWECMHCHDDAQDIENALDEAEERGEAAKT